MIGKTISARQAVKRMLLRSGGLSLAQRLTEPRVAILRYHSVQDEPARFADSIGEGIIHSTQVFREQMEILARDFDPVTLDDIQSYLCEGRRLPPRPVAVTFDDGFADNAEVAAPIMDRLGLKGAFYITVDSVDSGISPWYCRLKHAFAQSPRETWVDSEAGTVHPLTQPNLKRAAFLIGCERCARRSGKAQKECVSRIEIELDSPPMDPGERLMMTWEQATTLILSGHIVGSHTLSHPNVAQIDPSESAWELTQSRVRLEEQLETPVVHFSYPHPILHPHWTSATVEQTRQAGYHTAVTTVSGPVQSGDDPLCLKRVNAPSDPVEFLWSLMCSLLGRRL